MALSLPCPSCKATSGVIAVGGPFFCKRCSRTWPNRSAYDVSVVLAGGLGEPEVDNSDESVYIEDGGLRNDLNDLVRQSQMHILELVRSQLPIIDWDKTGNIATGSMDLYLRRMIADLKDRNL